MRWRVVTGLLFERLEQRPDALPERFALDAYDEPALDEAWESEPSCRRFTGD